MLDWLHRETGVLAEYSPQRFGFLHLGFQEYLAAAHVASRGEEHLDTLAAAFGERWWREVALLLVAMPGVRVFRPLFERLLATTAPVEHADLLHDCLREAAEVDVEPLVRALAATEDPGRQAAVLRLLRGRCDEAVLAAVETLATSPEPDVASLSRQILEGCREQRAAGAELALDLFLVHGPGAAQGAGELGSTLRRRGMKLFESGDWLSDLEAILKSCRGAVVLVGAGGELPWRQPETEAFLELFESEDRPLVPVLLPGATAVPELPSGLAWRPWVDLRSGLDTPALRNLERALSESEEVAMPVVVGQTVGDSWREPTTGIELLWIPGGHFEMGGDGKHDGKPVHTVRLSPFWLGETPVTNRQYGVFLEKTGHREPTVWRDRRFSDPEQPVVGVSWHDAVEFCDWLAELTNRQVKLPSEAQWEYAARGTEGRVHPWGDEPPDPSRACFGLDSQTDKPAAVGSCPAGRGPFGTLDQAGLVWEWCLDAWDPSAYANRSGSEPLDPVVTEGEENRRVFRGGGWWSPAGNLRSAVRGGNQASYRFGDVGFRVLAAPSSLAS